MSSEPRPPQIAPSSLWLNVGSGTHNAASPWVNIDTRVDAEHDTHPDVIVPAGHPLPYDDNSASRVYLGHVLEHVPWPAVPAFLAEVRRVLAPAGDLLVVGPDVVRTLNRWKQGVEPWWLVEAVLEHAVPAEVDGGWPEAGHWWNCHEARVVDLLGRCGFTVSWSGCLMDLPKLLVLAEDPMLGGDTIKTAPADKDWPITNPSSWQFAVVAR